MFTNKNCGNERKTFSKNMILQFLENFMYRIFAIYMLHVMLFIFIVPLRPLAIIAFNKHCNIANDPIINENLLQYKMKKFRIISITPIRSIKIAISNNIANFTLLLKIDNIKYYCLSIWGTLKNSKLPKSNSNMADFKKNIKR